jgi:hypothetical protein
LNELNTYLKISPQKKVQAYINFSGDFFKIERGINNSTQISEEKV